MAVAREGKTELAERSSSGRAICRRPASICPTDVKMPASLIFRDASSRDVFLTIARFANISLVFDPTFRETPVTVDLRNASLEDALSTVADATRTFYPRHRAEHRRSSSRTRRPSGASTRKRSSARST